MKQHKINLLPYRVAYRNAVAKRFFILCGAAAALGLGVMGVIHTYFAQQFSTQEERINYLNTEITNLDSQLGQISKLKEETAEMLQRKQVVESLQANRSRTVLLLNELAQAPVGISYTSVKQTGALIAITGKATSNDLVSNLISKFNNSSILHNPKLIETRVTNKQLEFSLTAELIDLSKKTKK